VDHGKVFVSDTFVSACRMLGVSVQPARAYTPTDKPRVAYCTSSGRSGSVGVRAGQGLFGRRPIFGRFGGLPGSGGL
jgi:hypothetical protein